MDSTTCYARAASTIGQFGCVRLNTVAVPRATIRHVASKTYEGNLRRWWHRLLLATFTVEAFIYTTCISPVQCSDITTASNYNKYNIHLYMHLY